MISLIGEVGWRLEAPVRFALDYDYYFKKEESQYINLDLFTVNSAENYKF